MISCDPDNHMESSHIKYATAMKDKEITPENELLAMREVVKDFLFDSISSQMYTASRLTQVYDYYQSGHLQNMLKEKDINEVREFMKEQPNIIGMGADKAEYKPENIIKLGDTPAGNLLEIQEGGLEHMKHPNFATIFMNDSEKRQIAELQQFSSLLTDIMQINADISKNIGNISELPTSDSQFFVNKINSRTSIPKVPYR